MEFVIIHQLLIIILETIIWMPQEIIQSVYFLIFQPPGQTNNPGGIALVSIYGNNGGNPNAYAAQLQNDGNFQKYRIWFNGSTYQYTPY
jgi:hypothetical protein